MNDQQDPFDAVFDLEREYIEMGQRDGELLLKEKAEKDALELGLKSGFKIALEIAGLKSFAEERLLDFKVEGSRDPLPAETSHFRLVTLLNEILKLTESFKNKNDKDLDLEELLKQLRAKYKIALSLSKMATKRTETLQF